jgi:TrmH family RNA methyltransferase
LSDPGNLGTLLRAAKAVGPCTVAIGEGVDPYSPKVVRASAGTIFSLPVARQIPRLPEHKIFSAVVRDGQPLFETKLPAKTVLVLGNEAHGLAKTRGTPLTLPMAADCESLNVAMAGTVLLYEYRRQIGFLPSG